MLTAELMEKFLLCNDCSTPIGSPHQSNCLSASMSPPLIWKKTKFDDKYITLGMNFSFYDIPLSYRKNILANLSKACDKQNKPIERPALSVGNKMWLNRWMRGGKKQCKAKPKKSLVVYHPSAHPPLTSPSAWTPHPLDSSLLPSNFDVVSFTAHSDDEPSI